jgi:hypothetical protein
MSEKLPNQLVADRLFMARVSEQALCFDEMNSYMKEVVENK